MAENAMSYLKKQLNFPLSEWLKLEEPYKAWYREAAVAEMETLGIARQEPVA